MIKSSHFQNGDRRLEESAYEQQIVAYAQQFKVGSS